VIDEPGPKLKRLKLSWERFKESEVDVEDHKATGSWMHDHISDIVLAPGHCSTLEGTNALTAENNISRNRHTQLQENSYHAFKSEHRSDSCN
jgi:hypothetical protein